MLKQLLVVVCGAFLGGIARYLFFLCVPNYLFVVNTIGSFLIGILYFKIAKTYPEQHLLVNVGFLGAFTSFSSFSLILLQLLQDGQLLKSIFYVLLSVFAGLISCFLGYKLATHVLI